MLHLHEIMEGLPLHFYHALSVSMCVSIKEQNALLILKRSLLNRCFFHGTDTIDIGKLGHQFTETVTSFLQSQGATWEGTSEC